VLDSEHPRELDCTPEQARDLVRWLHNLPNQEQVLVGRRRRPA
jgi:hypothetical protein